MRATWRAVMLGLALPWPGHVLAQSGRPAGAAASSSATWQELAANPARFIGHEVEVARAYCAEIENGGFQCSTDGAVFVTAPSLSPANVREKIGSTCGGADVFEKSPFCRVKIRFTPRSHRTSTTIGPANEEMRVFAADEIRASF